MASGTRETRLAATFVTLADTLVAGYDVLDLLDTLVNRCAELLGAAAAGLLLADDRGELDIVASTSERGRLVESAQLDPGAGPSLKCFSTGSVVTVPDIRDTGDQWPAFRDAAIEHGLLSVRAVPLRLRETIIGTLTVFGEHPGAMAEDDLAVAQGLADIATIGILHERALRENTVAREQLQYALDSRVVIEQAKGVLSHTHDVDMDAAFSMLRGYARSHGTALRQVAERVVDRSLDIDTST